jgi:hypothetical protein
MGIAMPISRGISCSQHKYSLQKLPEYCVDSRNGGDFYPKTNGNHYSGLPAVLDA